MGVGAIVWFVVGYLLGSIPFGLVVTRLAGTGDIRSIGSGNIGATNVLRTGSKSLAALTLIGDMLKGTAAVALAHWWGGRDMALVAALAAVIGHVFPVWLGFKGGKGVATFIGVLLGIAWPVAVAFGVIWGAVAASTRFSSVAGLTATAAAPVILWFLTDARAAIVFALLAALIFVMHRANIARLLAGTEPKIGQRRDAAA